MFRNPNNFEKLLDDATNSYLLEIDWQTILKLCDLIRQGDINPKQALAAIQKKICNPNSHVSYYGLIVLESCVKNCGALVQDEISSKSFMEKYKEIIKSCQHENVKTKGLDLLQSWAFAFRTIPKYRAVTDSVNIMKAEGYKFPALKESDAMFVADIAPEWEDGDCCHRCRRAFGFLVRKHHCRACGQIFCQDCSSRTSTLPKFGIEKEVRVCESCYEKYKTTATYIQNELAQLSFTKGKRRPHKSRKSSPSWSKTTLKPGSTTTKAEELPSEYLASSLSQQNQHSTSKKTEEELKEEEELQLALALSQSEAESKKSSSSYRPVTRSKSFSPPVSHKMSSYDAEDSELMRYLNRPYWESRANTSDSRPYETEEQQINVVSATHNYDNKDKADENATNSESEIEEFVSALRGQVEIFVNRMKSNSSRGRSISNDTSVQTLFLNITAMHSKLLRYIQQQDDSRVYYEALQDKLTQVKDARAALDALREEHRDRLRRDAEMAERQRQIQMAQKLEIMRQKKQEYLLYQRQLALQRIHDQERELHLRQEQQKQQYRLNNTYGPLPYMPPTQGNVSAFEPVSAMGLNSLPPVTVATGPFGPQTFQPPHFNPGQNVQSIAPPQQPQMGTQQSLPQHQHPAHSQQQQQQQVMPPPQMQSMMIGPPPNATYVPVNQPSRQTNAGTLIAGPPPRGPHYHNTQPQMLHTGGHLNSHGPTSTSQSQLAHAMMPPSGTHMEHNPHMMGASSLPPSRVEPNTHIMGPPPGIQQHLHAGPMMQHPIARSMVPPSSPLSSPSSSSEHSLIQHGSQPMPSAPSATSTPQPEEKEEVAELILFD